MSVFVSYRGGFVIPIDKINESTYKGGFEAYVKDLREKSGIGNWFWYDEHLLYYTWDFWPEKLIEFWESHGLQSTETIDGVKRWKDMAVVDDIFYQSLKEHCPWITVIGRAVYYNKYEEGERFPNDEYLSYNVKGGGSAIVMGLIM